MTCLTWILQKVLAPYTVKNLLSFWIITVFGIVFPNAPLAQIALRYPVQCLDVHKKVFLTHSPTDNQTQTTLSFIYFRLCSISTKSLLKMEYKRKIPWLKVIPIQTEITRMCAKVFRQNLEKRVPHFCQLMIDTNEILNA